MKAKLQKAKTKFVNWIINHKKELIGTGLFVLVGAIVMLIGFAMTGWSIIEWLKSPWATTFFVVAALGLLLLVLVWWYFKRKSLIGGDDK